MFCWTDAFVRQKKQYICHNTADEKSMYEMCHYTLKQMA